jgi:predicted AAA+ superfamily ATPase
MKFEYHTFEFHGPNVIPRQTLDRAVRSALRRSRAVVLSGPRQSGKTTLARTIVDPRSPNYFDLEDPVDARRLEEPMTALTPLRGLVVIDEVQRHPGLFPVLRVLIDRSDAPGQFLLLGSASPALLRQAGESLLGRAETVEVSGFDLEEVCAGERAEESERESRLWLRGGFPRSFLAESDVDSMAWRRSAIASHVEFDLPQFGVNVAPVAMMRFWRMLAHYHGQIWSAAEPARSLGVSEPTVRRYLDTLTQTLMVRQLAPWHANLAKRQVKSPKIYFRDSGLLHALMDVTTNDQLLGHPRSGASWEGFALEQVIRLAAPDEMYFWATHQGAELDLLLIRGRQRVGVDFKRTDAPRVTRSMRIAMDELQLDTIYVVYPGDRRLPLGEGMEAVPLRALMA